MNRSILILIISIFCVGYSEAALGQNDSTSTIKYSTEFKFNDGLYLTFHNFIYNSPTPKKFIISNKNIEDFYFYNHLVENETIAYYDKYGLQQSVLTGNIWGFCREGELFIQIENEFHRIPVIGRICHFVASKKVANSPTYSPYNQYGYNNQPITYTEVATQFILDTKTGKVNEFTNKTLTTILMEDPELYDDFTNLSKRKQRKQMYIYLRRFNEKNPLYIKTKK